MNRDSLVTLVVPLVAIACCLAIPLLVSAGVGGTFLALGLGLPLAAGAVVVAWGVVRRHRMG